MTQQKIDICHTLDDLGKETPLLENQEPAPLGYPVGLRDQGCGGMDGWCSRARHEALQKAGFL
jgi:hypothetical protein